MRKNYWFEKYNFLHVHHDQIQKGLIDKVYFLPAFPPHAYVNSQLLQKKKILFSHEAL